MKLLILFINPKELIEAEHGGDDEEVLDANEKYT